MAMIFLYPSGLQYKCCTIHADSNKEIALLILAVRQTLMDRSNTGTPKVLCFCLLSASTVSIPAYIRHCRDRSLLWKSLPLSLSSSDYSLLFSVFVIPSRSFIVE